MKNFLNFLTPLHAAIANSDLKIPQVYSFNKNMLCHLQEFCMAEVNSYSYFDFKLNKMFGNKFSVVDSVPDGYVFIWNVKKGEMNLIHKIKLR